MIPRLRSTACSIALAWLLAMAWASPGRGAVPRLQVMTGSFPSQVGVEDLIFADGFEPVVVVMLTVGMSGGGTGTVTSTPAGISCPADCTENYIVGTVVTLTAAPGNSTFGGWGGACAGTGTCMVTMDAAKSVTANYVLSPLTITPSTQAFGSVPSGASSAAIAFTVDNTGGVTVTGLSVALLGSDATSFTITNNNCPATLTASTVCTVSVKFNPLTIGSKTASLDVSSSGGGASASLSGLATSSFALTVGKPGSGTGTVTSSPAGISCGPDCSENYNGGEVVTLTAVPGGNSTFGGWGGVCRQRPRADDGHRRSPRACSSRCCSWPRRRCGGR